MNWNSTEFKVGLLVLLSCIVFAFLLLQSANWPWTSSGEEVIIHFDSTSDLRIGAMVQIAGVEVGQVTGIKLLVNKVEVTTRIEDAYSTLRKGSKINISMVGFVGETYVNIRNGPASNRLITRDDLPLDGKGLLSTVDIMESANRALEKINSSADILDEIDKNEVKTIVSSLKNLVVRTDKLTGQTLSNLNELVLYLNEIVTEYKSELDSTIADLNYVMSETQTNVAQVSQSLNSFSNGLNKLLNENSAEVEETVDNFRQLSEDLSLDSEKLFTDLQVLKSDISKLVNSTQAFFDKDAEKLDKLVENLNQSTQNFNEISHRLNKIMYKVESGEGTVAKLLNEDESLENLNDALESTDIAAKELTELSNKIDKKVEKVQIPSLQWDYELRYNNLSESLRNEIALNIGNSYRIGLSALREDIDLELQYEYSFRNFVARAGFIRSKPGLGVEYWLFSNRLGLSLEGIGITEDEPSIDLETKLKFMPNLFIIIGAQNVARDIDYSGGIKIKY